MPDWKKRGVAWVCALLMALAAVFGIGGLKLYGIRSDVEKLFFEGDYCPYQDLMECRESAYNLYHLGESTLPDSDRAMKKTVQALEDLEKAKTIEDYYRANGALDFAVEELYAALEKAQLTERQQQAAYRQYNNFCGRQNSLSLDDSYNGKAQEYNRLCYSFPAVLIAYFTGNWTLPVFAKR